MIRVELPAHLRTLARVGSEVSIDVQGPITQRSVLDALEAAYPVLRGTIRDHGTLKRRAFLRFFACEQDLSGVCVAVVDDVMTTGATLNEFARTLKHSGAARVENWVVARTPRGV